MNVSMQTHGPIDSTGAYTLTRPQLENLIEVYTNRLRLALVSGPRYSRQADSYLSTLNIYRAELENFDAI